jgi:hypothetical protein
MRLVLFALFFVAYRLLDPGGRLIFLELGPDNSMEALSPATSGAAFIGVSVGSAIWVLWGCSRPLLIK